MQTAHDIAAEFTQREIARWAGVGVTAVNNSLKRTGAFPPSWFVPIRDALAERGLECPEAAFNFKTPSNEAAPSAEADG